MPLFATRKNLILEHRLIIFDTLLGPFFKSDCTLQRWPPVDFADNNYYTFVAKKNVLHCLNKKVFNQMTFAKLTKILSSLFMFILDLKFWQKVKKSKIETKSSHKPRTVSNIWPR